MKRFLLPLICVASMALGVHAVPAYPGLMQMSQPDGTTVQVKLIGDETGHYYLSSDNLLLIETAEGFFYAEPDGAGGVRASRTLAADPRHRKASAGAFVAGLDQKAMRDAVEREMTARRSAPIDYVNGMRGRAGLPVPVAQNAPFARINGMNPPSNPIPGTFPGSNFPTIGTQKVLVILVEFSDVKFKTPDAHNYFDKQLNGRQYTEHDLTGSCYDYYSEASFGQFQPQFDCYGPITLTRPQAYYGGNDVYGNDLHPREMVVEACNMLAYQGVSFKQYDNNNDGRVDNVFVYYAGRGEATGGGANTIWPHSWSCASLSPKYGSGDEAVTLDSYACTNELVIRNNALATDAIGTFCHEFGHVLGLPDLYSTDYSNDANPDSWTLMCSGSYNDNSRTPPTLSSFERGCLGWLNPIVLQEEGTFVLNPDIQKTNQAYLIPTANPNEFFLLENRLMDRWDMFVPAEGMLVWHIDYNPEIWNYNAVNNDGSHQYVDIVEAHGKNMKYHSWDTFTNGQYFSLTYTTKPKLADWKGNRTDISLEKIEEENEDWTDPNYGRITLTTKSFLGVKEVAADSWVLSVEGMTLRIPGLTVAATVYDVNGMVTGVILPGESFTVPAHGLYIVRTPTESVKVAI